MFWGADWNKNELIARVIRRTDNVAEVWLILRINGKLYQLPHHPETRRAFVDPSNVRSFKAGGLHLQCQWPMRRWRISYNGLLKNVEDSGKTHCVHVKFSFLWMALSGIHDNLCDFNNSSLASALERKSVKFALENFNKFFDNYEQWGMFCGTVMVETEREEKELWMWGSRRRLMGHEYPTEEKIRLDVSMKDGMKTSLEVKNISGIFNDFRNGHCHYKDFREYAITACKTNLMEMVKKQSLNSEFDFIFTTARSRKVHTMTMQPISCSGVSLEGVSHRNILYTFQVKFEDVEGLALLQHSFGDFQMNQGKCIYPPLLLFDKEIQNSLLAVAFEDVHCQSSRIVGGKGLSLGLLSCLSSKFPQKFSVPKGCVLTTVAYERHVNHEKNIGKAIDFLRETLCLNVREEVEDACKRVINTFENSEIDDKIKEALVNILKKQFGESYNDKLFAIRSSACGEDGEELSAAGQMSTYLGVKGLSSIFTAIIRCWASHFKYESVQYLRQNGQLITSPVAVVIQEMVKAEIAGVLFTVHPVTGDPSFLVLTANYGLGESVVSALSEPDTITLRRLTDRNDLEIHQVEIGSKTSQIILTKTGTEEKEVDSSERLCRCISDEMALKLGEIGLLIEDCFCSERDIEWAIKDGSVFLLQARPITALDNETEFELIHDQDTALPTDNECITLANVGEDYIKPLSPLSTSLSCLLDRIIKVSSNVNLIVPSQAITYCDHYSNISHRRFFLNFVNVYYRLNSLTPTITQKVTEMTIFGHPMDKKYYNIGVNRYGYTASYNIYASYILTAFLYILKFFSRIEKTCQMINNYKKSVNELSVLKRSEEIYLKIIDTLCVNKEICKYHVASTTLSGNFMALLFKILGNSKSEWDEELYSDIGELLSSCENVTSADVPKALNELSACIKKEGNWEEFVSLSPRDAVIWLEENKGIVGEKYKNFLQIHGHRGFLEIDVCSKSWRTNPEGLITPLQISVQNTCLNTEDPPKHTVEDSIKNLKTPLGFVSKCLLSYLLPHCRKAVSTREMTKSLFVESVDTSRKAYETLGKSMVLEGRLPSSDLVYFLSLDELRDLIETRSSNLVSKAIKRQKLTNKMNMYEFPEIINGIPRPLNKAQAKEEKLENETIQLKGTAVSQGIVTAKARIIFDFEEAKLIKVGEILICKTTNTVWTPYFPLLAGLITEHGGLISHGAVIAREYGIPCLISVKHATQVFKTGDIVKMDTTKGIISRVDVS